MINNGGCNRVNKHVVKNLYRKFNKKGGNMPRAKLREKSRIKLIKKLKLARKANNLFPSEVDRKLGLIRTTTLSVENFEMPLDISTLIKMCKLYRIEIDYILTDCEHKLQKVIREKKEKKRVMSCRVRNSELSNIIANAGSFQKFVDKSIEVLRILKSTKDTEV